MKDNNHILCNLWADFVKLDSFELASLKPRVVLDLNPELCWVCHMGILEDGSWPLSKAIQNAGYADPFPNYS